MKSDITIAAYGCSDECFVTVKNINENKEIWNELVFCKTVYSDLYSFYKCAILVLLEKCVTFGAITAVIDEATIMLITSYPYIA